MDLTIASGMSVENSPVQRTPLKGIETRRGTKKGRFADNQPGVLNEIAFVAKLFKTAA